MQAPDSGPPDTPSFPRFGELPKEIQIKIWGHAASNSHTIVVDHIVSRNPDGSIREYYGGKEPYDIASPVSPPLMRVCYEARKAAKNLYDIANLRKGMKFYMNQDADILYLKGTISFRVHLKGRVKRAERQHTHYFSWLGVRHLAFDVDILSHRSGCELYVGDIVRKFFSAENRVDKIYVVYQKPEDRGHAMQVAGIWSVDFRAFLRYNTRYLKRLIKYPLRIRMRDEPIISVKRDTFDPENDSGDSDSDYDEDVEPKFGSNHERWKGPEWIPILISELPAS